MRLRTMAAGAAAAIAVGGLTLAVATPTHAQEGGSDLEIGLVGTTIAEGAAGKFGTLKLINHGPQDASGIEFTYDISALDTSKVEILLEDCVPDGSGIAVCVIDPDGLANSQHVNFVDFLEVLPGATGAAGSITMSITHAGTDPDPSNNSVTAPVTIAGDGPDLLVVAPDVHEEVLVHPDPLEIERRGTPIAPGGEAIVEVFVANQGTQDATGIEMSITLPEHVTFTFPEPECSHESGDSSTTCSYPSVTLTPGYGPDVETCDGTGSCGWFIFPVRVSDEAPSPASLTGGVAEAWAMEVMLFTAPAQQAPHNLMEGPAPDVDPTDNTSAFTVFVDGANDLAGSSVPAEGEIGDVVDVEFTLTNHGPATSRAAGFTVQAPAGTVILSQAGVFEYFGNGTFPIGCQDGDGSFEGTEATELTCGLQGEFGAGGTLEFTLPFEIRSVVGDDGLITAVEFNGMDHNPGNDTAPIVINPPGGGQGGGLPVTGAPALLIGGAGAAVLVAGTVLFFVARRRRLILAAPDTDG